MKDMMHGPFINTLLYLSASVLLVTRSMQVEVHLWSCKLKLPTVHDKLHGFTLGRPAHIPWTDQSSTDMIYCSGTCIALKDFPVTLASRSSMLQLKHSACCYVFSAMNGSWPSICHIERLYGISGSLWSLSPWWDVQCFIIEENEERCKLIVI